MLRPIAKSESSARFACRKGEAATAAQFVAPQEHSRRSNGPLREAVTPTSARAQASALEVAQVNSFTNVFVQVGAPLSGREQPQGGGSYA